MIIGLLEWIGRALFVLFIFRVVARLFSSGGARPASHRSAPTGNAEREGGTLVRDPQCGTHVPKSRSFQVGHGATALYFCSTDCRDKYAAAHGH
jgi:YHS domain-containing protein